MKILHLTDSPFFGGPERQILGLMRNMPPEYESQALCFNSPNDTARPFIEQVRRAGFDAHVLDAKNPAFREMIAEIRTNVNQLAVDVVFCHGYKADILGWLATRRTAAARIAVSRGWTAHTRKVRFNDALDRRVLRLMDAVVCVSSSQAEKVMAAGISPSKVRVIRNAIDTDRFAAPDPAGRDVLQSFFSAPPRRIVLAIGRLSPEKGFDQLVEAARIVLQSSPDTGFAVLGAGPELGMLEQLASQRGIASSFVFPGFRSDVDRLLPFADVIVQSSFTEGLPNVLLEACAAGVPVVATRVGGTEEVITHGSNGILVPAGSPDDLARAILELIESPRVQKAMGERGRSVVQRMFSFEQQSREYQHLLSHIRARRSRRPRSFAR